MSDSAQDIEVVGDRERAEVLIHPLRLRILDTARDPGSASELARRLALKPQKVNYHVKRLAGHGFLRLVDERRAGNVVEKVYAATADRYVLASSVLGELSPRAEDAEAVASARWFALQARAETELGEVLRETAGTGQAVPTFSMDAELRFETTEQRAMFVRAVEELLMAIVSKYASPARTESGEPGPGQPYRLLLGCYPVPGGGSDEPTDPQGDGGVPETVEGGAGSG